MKKKFFFGILFSAILAINVISVSKTDISDLSLMRLMQITQAQAEADFPTTCWDTYTAGIGCFRLCNNCTLFYFGTPTGSSRNC